MTPAIKFVNDVRAWDVKVGDKVRVHPERSFHTITAIDFHYPGEQHLGQSIDQTVRLDVGWGCSYHEPDDLVEVLTLVTVDALIDSVLS